MPPRVMTVSGPIPPERVNFTLPHEHTSISFWQVADGRDQWGLSRDDELITDELRDFRRRGGSCLVDLTVPGVGRDPAWLRTLATRTGLWIVMGCGWYSAAHYPAEAIIDRRSVDDLADELVREFEEGVGEARIRPGIIGEIGTDRPWINPAEERVHRAAARAAKRTGLAITTHGLRSEVGLDQLRIFAEEGVDPSRVVIGHADSHPNLDFYIDVLEQGANLQFDSFGHRPGGEDHSEPRLTELLVELLDRGYGGQLLLSQDVSRDANLKANGGHGYTYLLQHFLPHLRTAAVGEGEIRRMTVDNPRRILTIG